MKNKEKQAASAKKHYENNKDKLKAKAKLHNIKARARNRRFVFDYLLSNPCIDCGESNPIVLEFDHRNPSEKTGDVSTMMGNCSSLRRISAEIEKCDVRCANCHRIRTATQRGWYNFG